MFGATTSSARVWRVLRLSSLWWAGLIGLTGGELTGQTAALPPITETHLIRVWTTETGYPHIAPTSFAETPDGYLWVGSFGNLTRFDGAQFEVIAPAEAPALGRSMVLHLHTARDGSLWVGTDHGVGRRQGERWTWFGRDQGVPEAVTHSLGEWNGAIFVTVGGQAYLCDDGRAFHALDLPAEATRDLLGSRLVATSDDELWLINPQRLYRRVGRGWELLQASADPAEQMSGATAAHRGGLWVVSRGRLTLWQGGRIARQFALPPGVGHDFLRLLETADGAIWFGSTTSGIVRLAPDGRQWKATMDEGLENHAITQLFEDSRRNVWAGTNGGGVARLRRKVFTVFDRSAGLPQPVINALLPAAPGEWWVATHGAGLQVWRGGRFTPLAAPDSPVGVAVGSWPLALADDGAGGRWVGTFGNGLVHLAADGRVAVEGEEVLGDGVVSALLRARDGRLWLAGRTAISIRDAQGIRRLGPAEGVPAARYHAWAEDAAGVIWTGSRTTGLLRWDGRAFVRERLGAGDEWIEALHVDRAGRLWAGLGEGGLAVRAAGRWRRLDRTAGWPGDVAYTLNDDPGGNLWVGTERRVLRLSAAALRTWLADPAALATPTVLDQTDGLPSSVREGFSGLSVVDAAGGLWLATMRGVARLDTTEAFAAPPPPVAQITGLSVAGRAIPPPDPRVPVRVPPGARRVSVAFTAVDLADGEALQFETRLRGRDEDWQSAGKARTAEFTGLPSGAYGFTVRAVAKDGTPGRATEVVALEIAPFYWQTWWFRTAVVLLVAAGAGLAVVGVMALRQRRRVAELHREHHQLRTRIENEHAWRERALAGSAARQRSDLLATMGYEIRTPLTGVLGSAELLLETDLAPEQRDEVASLRASAEALSGVLNSILDYSRMEAGRLALEPAMFDLRRPLVEAMEALPSQLGRKDVELVLAVHPALPVLVNGDPVRLRQVFDHLLRNAVHFTEHGRIVLRAEPESVPGAAPAAAAEAGDARIRFTVSDTGSGIPPEIRAQLFYRMENTGDTSVRRPGASGLGLALSRRLVELMGGWIEVESAPGQGAKFTFALELPVDLPASEVPLEARPVLVLDDLPEAAEALAWTARVVGLAASVAPSVPVALERLRSAARRGQPYEALLLDESAARAAGDAFSRALENEDELRRLPIVWLGSAEVSAGAGWPGSVSAVLRKPVLRPEALLDAIERAIKAGRAPLADVAPLDARAPADPAAAWCRVLLVEDDDTNRMVTRKMLERLGCTVDLAENGREAVAMTARSAYDLVFMDCRMPEMDGFTATAEILRRDGPRAAPIVALTANTAMEDRARCLAVGMVDFLAKPVRKTELFAALERHARRLEQPPEAAADHGA